MIRSKADMALRYAKKASIEGAYRQVIENKKLKQYCEKTKKSKGSKLMWDMMNKLIVEGKAEDEIIEILTEKFPDTVAQMGIRLKLQIIDRMKFYNTNNKSGQQKSDDGDER